MDKAQKVDFAYRNNSKTLRRLLENGQLWGID
jgi:hypothetical protein